MARVAYVPYNETMGAIFSALGITIATDNFGGVVGWDLQAYQNALSDAWDALFLLDEFEFDGDPEDDWDEAEAFAETKVDDPEWIKETGHNTQTYVFTKECLNMYVCHKAWEVAARQIRMNTTCPGPILTPMHGFFRVASGHDFDSAMPTSPCGRESLPEEQAGAMLLLNSNLASYISGVALDVDFGLAYNIVYYGGIGAPGDH